MPRKRVYKVRGTNDFLVLAVIFLFLGIWGFKDGWFPSKGVLKKHPLEMTVYAEIDGVVDTIRVKEGEQVLPPTDKDLPTLMVELNMDSLDAKIAQKQQLLEAAEGPSRSALLKEIAALDEQRDLYQIHCPKLGKEHNGKVAKLLVEELGTVQAGDPVAVIYPNTHFYLFNKSLTVFSALAFLVFMVLHLFGR